MNRVSRRGLSKERMKLHAFGLGLGLASGIGLFVCFIGFAVGNPVGWWVGGVFCMAGLVVGRMLRRVAARGVAGSGLVLDPEKSREDLEPWARVGGGLLRDAVDEAGLGSAGADARPEVKVRCRKCRVLNDEEAKFCDQCGAEL